MRYSCSGISNVTKLDASSITLMINAAAASSFRVAAILLRGTAASGSAPPETNGMTETPVSNPLKPRASFGKMTAEASSKAVQSPCAVNPERQCDTSSGRRAISTRPRDSTTAFSAK